MEDKLHLELVKLQEELTKLKNAVEYIESAKQTTELAVNLIKSVDELNNSFRNLSEKNELLLGKIDKVDFPERLSIMETSLNSMNTNMTNLHLKFELSERNIRDQIQIIKNNLSEEMDKKLVKLTTQLNEIKSQLKTSSSELNEINLKLFKINSNFMINRFILFGGFLLVISIGIILIYIK